MLVESAVDDDQRLVAAVRRGDERAFEMLYSRYQRRIHVYVMGMVKDHGRAEDVTQEVFVSALRRMRATERPIAFKPWIYEIAKNACIDQFRRSRRTEEVSLQADDGLAPGDYGRLAGSDPAPHDAVAAKQDIKELCGAFGGLSDNHYEILLLRELEGLSYREIGKRMGMTRPAVESTLFRARRRLTEEYDELVSGARCLRVQGIIATGAQAQLGTRETRRLSQHLSHCQPCRREAMAAGLDAAILTRIPLRRRAAAKVAGWLPFPFLRSTFGDSADRSTAALAGPGWTAHVPMLSEQLSSGWGKLAAAAAVVVAGVGAAGVGTQIAGDGDGDAPASRTRATEQRSAATQSTAAEPAGGSATTRPAVRRGDRRGTDRNGTRGPGDGAPAGPATSAADAGAGAGAGATGAAGGGIPKPKLPDVTLPIDGTGAVAPVTNAADKVVGPVADDVTGAVEEAAAPVTETVDDAAGTADDAAGGLPLP